MRRPKAWSLLIILPSLALLGAAALSIAAAPPRLPDALAQQRQLAAQQPDNPVVLNDLGNLLRLAGELEEAEAVYRRALELAPERTTTRFNLAVLLSQRGEQREALAEIDQLLAADPTYAWAYYQRGVLLAARGDKEGALEAYAAAFGLNPELAFDDVNPHVIDNPLVTEALLMAYHRNPVPPNVPSAYEDPARISQLLAPPAMEDEAEEEAAEASGEGSARSPSSGQVVPQRVAPGGGALPGGEASAHGQDKVLSADDLEPGSNLGQATAPGATVPGPRGGDRSWTWPKADGSLPQLRNYPPSAGGRTGGSQVTRPQPLPNAGAIPRPRFRPGVRSSGRLELQLVPLPGERPAAERAG